ASGALVLIGCAVVLLAFFKRETLRLAGELEEARRAGAESFDKLDTCVASHRLAQTDAAACRVSRDRDRAECAQTLESIEKSGSTTAAEHAREIQKLQALYTSRLKTCEEGAVDAARAGLAAREQMAAEADKARAS